MVTINMTEVIKQVLIINLSTPKQLLFQISRTNIKYEYRRQIRHLYHL